MVKISVLHFCILKNILAPILILFLYNDTIFFFHNTRKSLFKMFTIDGDKENALAVHCIVPVGFIVNKSHHIIFILFKFNESTLKIMRDLT